MESDSRSAWRWNPDLQVARETRGGEDVVVLHDPAHDDYFQLGITEFELARAFGDGRVVEAVHADLVSRGSEPPALEDLAAFAGQLATARLLLPLEGDAPVSGPDRSPQPWWRRLLAIEVAALRPESFFRRVAPLLGWCFRPAAFVAGTGLVVLASGIVLGAWSDLRWGWSLAWSGSTLFAVWILYGLIILVHEMAHGFACAHFGGRVRAMGFLLMYGKPCAYCDVSDAWLLPKSARLWIMAAGSLIELWLWAAAVLVWRVTAPETLLHRSAMVVMAICGVGTLLNFNPLLKFDGYYMLSDGLEIPNLRERAFRDLAQRVLRRPRDPATARERRVFWIYGVAALAYSALVLGFLVIRLHAWMTSVWGGTGSVLFWGVVSAVSVRPVFRSATGVVAWLRRGSRSRRWFGAGAGLAAVMIAGSLRLPLRVSAESRLEPGARTVVRSPVTAVVESVVAREGERIVAGAPLVTLATRDLDFALSQARSEVDELEARLSLLEAGARPEEIDMARRRAEAAAARVRFDRLAYERAVQGVASDVVSKQALETAERGLQLAEEEQRTARKALDLLLSGTRPEEIRAMQARLEAVRTEAARLSEDRGRTRILAPHGGQVLSSRPERLQGRFVERGDSLLVLAEVETLVLEIPVSEKDVVDVQVGSPVRFKSRSLADRTFHGQVVAIAPAATNHERQRTVLVRSEIPNLDGLLRPDTSGFAKIECGERTLAALVSRRVVRTLRTEFWSWWW